MRWIWTRTPSTCAGGCSATPGCSGSAGPCLQSAGTGNTGRPASAAVRRRAQALPEDQLDDAGTGEIGQAADLAVAGALVEALRAVVEVRGQQEQVAAARQHRRFH